MSDGSKVKVIHERVLLQGDVIMMLRGYLDKLTISEMNCFMVGNNATLAGFMFGLLTLFGVRHILLLFFYTQALIHRVISDRDPDGGPAT